MIELKKKTKVKRLNLDYHKRLIFVSDIHGDISSLKEGLENHTIGICGDLKFGRTVHSLIKAMGRYKGNKFILISPKELQIPDYIRDEVLRKNNIELKETAFE